MPLVAGIGAGGPATTNGRTFLRQTLVLAAGAGSSNTEAIEVIGLNTVSFYAIQQTGTLTSVRFQFSVSSDDGVASPAIEWLDYEPAVALPAGPTGAPLRRTFPVAARFVRMQVIPGAGGNNIEIVITASA